MIIRIYNVFPGCEKPDSYFICLDIRGALMVFCAKYVSVVINSTYTYAYLFLLKTILLLLLTFHNDT